MPSVIILLALFAAPSPWRASSTIQLQAGVGDEWKITSAEAREFEVTSVQEYQARPGDVFEVRLRVRVDLHTRALPELACYDAAGREIPAGSALEKGPGKSTTNWQDFRRVFPVQPGTASIRARVRGSGRGTVLVAGLEFRRAKIDTYQTGALISPAYPGQRRGLVLESNPGIVNRELLSPEDRDGDGKWALTHVDLDKISKRQGKGVDWRTKFEYQPNEIYWSDGAVLKSDSVLEDRRPDPAKALHFRMKVHPGPYRVILSDPGRAVAISLDGHAWKRYEGGDEAELGAISARDGILELWIDACYRDPVSAGPAYFDYVRLFPEDHAPSVDGLFAAARSARKSAVVAERPPTKVNVTLSAPAPANWPVRCGLPIPQGQLAEAGHVAVSTARGRVIPSQNRVMATWPDGSVKWLYLDFVSTGETSYTVAYGAGVRAAQSPSTVRIRKVDAGIEVDTGAFRFTVSKSRFGLVENPAPIPVEITESSGKVWNALDLPVEKLEVEQAGPMHAVILVETKLAPSGKAASGFFHRARIHAYAGSPLVEIDYFVANTDSRAQVKVRSIALKISAQRMSAGVAESRQQGPKAMSWKPDGLEIDLWSPDGGDYDWVQGVGKTHHISLLYGPPSADPSLFENGPVLALADRNWYTASGALGPIAPAASSPLPAVEKTLASHMAESIIGHVGTGFENYGDHSSHGYVAGTYLWDNNEYDTPAAALIHFARTGNGDALRIGLASAQHYLDVDTIHYSSKHKDWAGGAHTHSHGEVGHHTADGPGMHHAGYVQGLIWHSYFTGEPDGILGARGIADWVLRNIKPESNVGQAERAMGHPLMTLNDVYEATWDDRYLRGSARLVDWSTKWEHPVRSGFLAPITEQPAYYSGSVFNGGLLPSALIKFNSWAKLPEIDQMLERVARWTLTDMWLPPDAVRSKGGSPSRKGDAKDLASHLRLMRYEFLRTGDPLFLVLPRECVVAGFGEDAHFGTRSTGLVYNYLPWFLSLLSDQGDPVPDPVPPGRDIAIAAGASARVCFELPSAATDLKATFQPRLDFAARQLDSSCYDVQAPRFINLTSESNRISYAHWTAAYRRAGRLHLAHAWVRITLR